LRPFSFDVSPCRAQGYPRRTRRLQNFIELCVESVDSQVKDAYHHGARFVAPMALAVGFWVFFMNFMDMLLSTCCRRSPVASASSICAPCHRPIRTSIGMSLTVFLIAFGYSFVAKGVKGVGAEFLFHPFGKWMLPIQLPAQVPRLDRL